MPDDKIQISSTSSGPSTGIGFGVNTPVLPTVQANTRTTSPMARAATATWQGFVPGERGGTYSPDAFSSQRGTACRASRTTTDVVGMTTVGNVGGEHSVDMAALRFQLAMYQSTNDHPQCAVLADSFENAASSRTLDLNGISPPAVDQVPEEVWRELCGFVQELDVPPDTSHETAERWRKNLGLPSLAVEMARTRKCLRLEEAASSTEAKPSRKRHAVDDSSPTEDRPAKRTGGAVASTSTQPPQWATQQTTTPTALEARYRRMLDLFSANPEIPTCELVSELNASAASWPAVSEAVVLAMRRDFEAMSAVSKGVAPHNTASHVYAMVRNNARLTANEVRTELALHSSSEAPGMSRIGSVLMLARTAIDNGDLPGMAVKSSAGAAAKGNAERDLEVFRMLAELPSISSTWIAGRLGERAPKLDALKNLLMFGRIIHAAHHLSGNEVPGPLERIYLHLRDNEQMGADDPTRIKVLEDIWKQSGRPTNDFRRFRSLCLLAIDNKVFGDANGAQRGPPDPAV
ncbi:hypothetical protein BH10PSE18_BH10PSE18_11860 [soil metagenome]